MAEVRLSKRFALSLVYVFALLFLGCAEQRVPVPWQADKAGIESGFDLALPKIGAKRKQHDGSAGAGEPAGIGGGSEHREIRLVREPDL